MKLKKCLRVLSMILVLVSISCKSTPKQEPIQVYVMVYDYENNALKGVTIFEDNKEIGQTDIYGRFTFEPKNTSEINLKFQKVGYEIVYINDSLNENQVLYVKMGNGKYYAELAEELLDKKEFESALIAINKALNCEQRKDYEYLKTIIIGENKNEN